MNMLEIQILAPNMYKDPIGAMDMNTCSAWSQMYIWAIFAGVVLRSWAGERTTQFFLFIYLHFIMFFLVEFSDVACLDSKGAKSTVKYLYDHDGRLESLRNAVCKFLQVAQLDFIYIALL